NANILDCEIVRASGDGALVRLPGGIELEGRFTWPEHRQENGQASAIIRAEAFSLGAGPNAVDAEVKTVSFLGPTVSCILQVGQATMRAELPARQPPAVGEAITVHVEPEALGLITH